MSFRLSSNDNHDDNASINRTRGNDHAGVHIVNSHAASVGNEQFEGATHVMPPVVGLNCAEMEWNSFSIGSTEADALLRMHSHTPPSCGAALWHARAKASSAARFQAPPELKRAASTVSSCCTCSEAQPEEMFVLSPSAFESYDVGAPNLRSLDTDDDSDTSQLITARGHVDDDHQDGSEQRSESRVFLLTHDNPLELPRSKITARFPAEGSIPRGALSVLHSAPPLPESRNEGECEQFHLYPPDSWEH